MKGRDLLEEKEEKDDDDDEDDEEEEEDGDEGVLSGVLKSNDACWQQRSAEGSKLKIKHTASTNIWLQAWSEASTLKRRLVSSSIAMGWTSIQKPDVS